MIFVRANCSTPWYHCFDWSPLMNNIYEFRSENVPTASRAPDASLEELLACERLLFDLSARFANVAGEQVVAEIENALKQLLVFLGFDRSTFAEFTAEGKQNFSMLGTAGGRGAAFLLGPIPAYLHSWFVTELRLGHTIVIRSYDEFPPEAAAAAEYYRRVGIRFQAC